MHLLCTYMFYIVLIFLKYLHVITSVINFVITYIITLLTHRKPTHNTKHVPTFTCILPQ